MGTTFSKKTRDQDQEPPVVGDEAYGHLTIYEAVAEEQCADADNTDENAVMRLFRAPLDIVVSKVNRLTIDPVRYRVRLGFWGGGSERTFQLSGPHALQRTVASGSAAGVYAQDEEAKSKSN